jgi:hypothetical protein
MDTDTVCVGCGRAMVRQIVTPTWSYIFAVACGIIPVLTLGGIIPFTIGMTGASSCVGVSRTTLPLPLRLLACVGITVVCWVLFMLMIGAILAEVKH